MLGLMGILRGEPTSSKLIKGNIREEHLIEVKYCEDTRPGHQLDASSKQYKTMQAFESQKGLASHHPSWCRSFNQYVKHLHHLELGLD